MPHHDHITELCKHRSPLFDTISAGFAPQPGHNETRWMRKLIAPPEPFLDLGQYGLNRTGSE